MRPRTWWLALAVVAAATAPSASAATSPSLVVHTVASGLADPTAFTFARDGRIFYAERQTGRIRILDPGVSDTVFFTVPGVVAQDGLVGVALHPNFPATPYVYAYASRTVNGLERDQLLRITASGTQGTSMKVLRTLKAGTSVPVHHGGRILFGPDRKLYVMIGDEGDPANAQNLGVLAGKILRLKANGTVPSNNPIPSSPVFAYGLRNSIGFDFDPVTRRLWETDNGPECLDELDRIVAGGNYGWGPSETCATPPDPPLGTNQDGPSPILPERWFTPTTAPTGLVFCSACGLGSVIDGTLLFGEFLTGNVVDVQLDASGTHVVGTTVVYTHPTGVRSMEAGPDGSVYLSDSAGIYRLEPAA